MSNEQPAPTPGGQDVTPVARDLFHAMLSERERKGIETYGTCWLAEKTDGEGYGYIQISGRQVGRHRHAWEEATDKPIPDGLIVGHTCDVRACWRNDEVGIYEVRGVGYPRRGHLWIGTVAANNADRDDKRRTAIGERNTQTKLTDEQVREIRATYRKGVRGLGTPALAKRYGVDQETIWSIVTGRTRRHV